LGAFAAFYLSWFGQILDQLAERLEPEEFILVAYEAPTLPRARIDESGCLVAPPTTVATIRRLGFLGAALEGVAATHPARTVVRECFISSVKRELAGNGRAEKADMVAAARRAGIDLPPGEAAKDAADSFGVWLLSLRHWSPEHRARWDARLLSGRGQERLTAAQARDLFR
jgi:hypothetical protein